MLKKPHYLKNTVNKIERQDVRLFKKPTINVVDIAKQRLG